jgi:hypothetical protein
VGKLELVADRFTAFTQQHPATKLMLPRPVRISMVVVAEGNII